MPFYWYKCKCGKEFDSFSSIKKRNKPQKCPSCGGKATRDIASEFANFGRVNELMVDRPRYSDAMGINPDQLNEFRKHYPDSVYDDEGRLLVRNRAHKKREMKRRGYFD